MSFIVKAEGGAPIPPLPEGVYVGTCYLLAKIGEQYSKAYDKWNDQLIIGWQINGEKVTVEGAEQPRTMFSFYNAKLGEKASLRRDLECWRGKRFTPEELEGFDLRNILGTACQLQIVHNQREDGTVRAFIKAIMALPKGMPADPPTEKVLYDIEDDMERTADFPKIVQSSVAKSKEWQESHGAAPAAEADPFGAPPAEADKEFGAFGSEDDLPF